MPGNIPYKEQELLQKIAAGDEMAYSQLFHYWYPSLSSHVWYITRSFELTQEITLDVFTKIWMSRETLSEITHFKGYLWMMAKNQALNALIKIARERGNYARYVTESAPGQATHLIADDDNLQHILDAAIAQLPPQQQKVFIMSRQNRLKQTTIAAEMGLTVPTVKKYLQLATEFITRYMRERYPHLLPVLLFLLMR